MATRPVGNNSFFTRDSVGATVCTITAERCKLNAAKSIVPDKYIYASLRVQLIMITRGRIALMAVETRKVSTD